MIDQGSPNEEAVTGLLGLSRRDELSWLLIQAQDEVRNLGPLFSTDLKRLQTLRGRLDQERFHLAVLGQFKRGKSTLLNALLGDAILPTSVIPLTTEEGNSKNSLKVSQAEVFSPTPRSPGVLPSSIRRESGRTTGTIRK